MFKQFSGAEYLMIDAATQFGLDKKTFEERIQWTKSNLNNLESLLPDAKVKPLFLKAVYAIRDTQAGKPTGHLVGLDASSSGLQIMSAVMGCYEGAYNTGLVNPDIMPDAYTTCTDTMRNILGKMDEVNRDDAKQAIMTYFYGSEAKPKEIFGDGTQAYVAFFKAAQELAPEAYDLRNILISIWQPNTLQHSWIMPDGFDVRIKVMQAKETVVKVPELNSSFTHIFKVNEGTQKGLSLAANVIHSIDGMLVREMNRRCNYNPDELNQILEVLKSDTRPRVPEHLLDKTELVCMAHIHGVNKFSVKNMSINFVTRLETLVQTVVDISKPFEIVCVHDEYKAHANNMDIVRWWYKEMLAELADSHIIQNIVRQICNNNSLKLTRSTEDLSKYIRNSNYALA